jgi:hypothetical protein
MLKMTFVAGALSLAAGLAAVAPTQATTFATYNPSGTSANISLSGLALSSSSAVTFDYLDAALSPLGDLSATLTLNATETGAVAVGPIALGTFDGAFALTYTGATKTVGAYTVHTGDDLLSGTFLGSVFSGYGTAGSVVDSILAGGLVSFNDNNFLTFDPSADQGLSIGMTSITPTIAVVGGKLTDFSAVSQGNFAANVTDRGGGGRGGVPEPASWAVMLVGVGLTGATLRARRRRSSAIA